MNENDLAAAVSALQAATRRLASAERAIDRGWDWRSVDGQVEE